MLSLRSFFMKKGKPSDFMAGFKSTHKADGCFHAATTMVRLGAMSRAKVTFDDPFNPTQMDIDSVDENRMDKFAHANEDLPFMRVTAESPRKGRKYEKESVWWACELKSELRNSCGGLFNPPVVGSSIVNKIGMIFINNQEEFSFRISNLLSVRPETDDIDYHHMVIDGGQLKIVRQKVKLSAVLAEITTNDTELRDFIIMLHSKIGEEKLVEGGDGSFSFAVY